MISFRSSEPRLRRALCRLALPFAVFSAARLLALPAFPGAEGFGANASGARGGTVYHVTNLNDSGAGSFRDAVSVSGRTVVFDVGGIITITSPIVVKPNLTIAGQTAPGGGITIYGDRLSYSGANNTITRYLRYREGINGDSGTDAVGAASGDLMMFDHVSASWGRDETFSLSGDPSNITLQDCIIGQGLLVHSAGSLMQTSGGVSIFRTLYTDNWMRNPKVKGVNDYENNVVYNWGSGGGFIPAGDSAGLSYVNMIGCYFVAGPSTPSGASPFKTGNLNFSLYHSGNYEDLNVNGALDGSPVTDASFPTLTIVGVPFDYPKPATVLTAQQAFAHVLAHAGASLHRDHADEYMIAELASIGTSGAQIYDESAIGGVGTVDPGIAAKDTDGDGMPDWWEEAAGTNPTVADNNGDIDGDGYTNLENYLNAIAPAGVPAATIDGLASDTGSSASDGVTSNNHLILHGTAAAGASVTLSRVDVGVIGIVSADGAGQWQFDYSGVALADRYYAFQAKVDLGGGKFSPPTQAFVVKVDSTPAAAPVITSIVASPSIVLNGTAEPGSTVTVTLVGTGTVGAATTDGYGNWTATYSGPALPPGSYTFTAHAVDLAGNIGAESASYSVDTSLAAPVFTGIVNDTGLSSSDRITNDTSLVLNGTSFANAVVTITRASVGVIGQTTANASGSWTFDYTATALPAGKHTFTATASNGSTSSPASSPFAVTIDTTRPTISSIRRLNPTTSATTASTLVFRVTFAEQVSGVDLSDFSLTLGTGVTATLSSIATAGTGVYDVTVTGVAGDSTVRLDLKSSGTGIVDVAGNALSGGYTSGQTYTIRLPGSGVWSATDSGLGWSEAANWQSGIVANGTGATADFAQQNIDGENVVQLDSPRTVGRVVFGDTDWSTPAQWTLADNGALANVLTLAGSTPTLQVDAATSSSGDTVDVPAAAATPSNLAVVLAGSAGFTKSGVGTLQIIKPATITGPLTITKGIVQIADGGSLSPSAVTIATSQQLRVIGGSFSTTGSVTWNSGTGTGIIVSGGVASFQRILPSNARNSFVKVTGGTMTATEITFPRSGDSESQALGVGIQVSGGELTVGTVGLGTADSWGAMTISGGRVNVTGAVNVGWQKTAGRGGDVVVSGGEFNVTDASTGLILARNPGTNTNNIGKFTVKGGVSNVARIALGYDATASAGSATVAVSDGELNLGSGGIVKNGGSGLAASVTVSQGVLGSMANWSTLQPIVLGGAASDVVIRAADHTDVAHDVTLAGGVTGTGGFTKTGLGTLTLGGTSTYAGATDVDAGTLRISGTLATSTELVSVNAGARLSGNGTLARSVVLNSGATIAPDGAAAIATLSAAALTWNGGGSLAIDVGANGQSDQLALGGALTKGTNGSYTVVFTPGAGFAAGNTYTIATFATTDFDAHDFTATGLPDGTGALFQIHDTSLQVRIQARPVITGPTSASGTYAAPFSTTVTSTELPVTFSAAGLPPGLALDAVTGVITGTPAAAGSFPVLLTATNTAGSASVTVTFSIAKALAPVAVGSPSQSTITRSYDGSAQAATITTTPAGLSATFTYNGSPVEPTLPGTYDVVATIDDPNYMGTATGRLVITITALVRHAPNVDGELDGSFQMLTPENVALNGSALVSGDLLVPGEPALALNGTAVLAGTREAAGGDTSEYTVTLNGGAMARYLVRHVDPIALPVVTAPQSATGNRNVVLNGATDSIGNPSQLRSLTVNGTVGRIVLPPGAYDSVLVNGGNTLVLGEAGGTSPAVYDLQRLTLNGNAVIDVAGPVVLRLATSVMFNGVVGSDDPAKPLTLELYRGGVTLNGSATVHAIVTAPEGAVMINGSATLTGRVSADRLVINGGGALISAP
jgi:rhamnogalacturonan endolyase